jgi:lipoprotein-anchoring transpeptidase ErfK/SrfK
MLTAIVLALAIGSQGAGASKADGAADALAVQVSLDRAGFSPGPIDGQMGANTRRALDAFRQARAGQAPPAVPATVTYTITPEDAGGPFVQQIPDDLAEQAKLPALTYTSVVEALAERFHATPALLTRLNPDAQFTAGETVTVPNVEPLVVPVEKPPMTAEARKEHARSEESRKRQGDRPIGTGGRGSAPDRSEVVVTVSKSTSALTVTDPEGRVIFYAPVTTGSENDPLPIGEWKVTGVQFTPKFHYNPDLFWDADPSHSKATIPPGPNNPVGMVWIDLSKPHYGLHGTPEPSAIGRSQSHGCVRLTNWDALKVAGMVKPGTAVRFVN